MNFPLITDPYFYAVAIPAVLLMGISKSGFGAGFGSLAVPLMALAVTVPQAAAILMPILFLMDVMGLAAFRKHFDVKLIRFLVPSGLLGTVVGTLSFKLLDARMVAGIVGVFTLVFLAQRLLFPPKPDSPHPPKWLGAILTVTSGFTSFVAHAGRPAGQRLRDPDAAAAAGVHGDDGGVLLRGEPEQVGARTPGWACSTCATWRLRWPCCRSRRSACCIGVRLAHRIRPLLFYRLIYAGMFLTGCKLVWDGFFK